MPGMGSTSPEYPPWPLALQERKQCLLDECPDDLQARGVEDILITCTDNLNGFTQTIRSLFTQ